MAHFTFSLHASTQVAADFLSYGTRRHHHGVDIETLRQELGHSDITTTRIELRSANTKSDRQRARSNGADRFSLAATCKPFLRRALADPSR
jgi:hypothetical protein